MKDSFLDMCFLLDLNIESDTNLEDEERDRIYNYLITELEFDDENILNLLQNTSNNISISELYEKIKLIYN